MTSPEQLLVGPADAARLLGISRSQLYKMLSAGRLPGPVRLGLAAPRWRVDELRQWVAAGAPPRDVWDNRRQDNHV
jgi:excisionase family DNA binding protein